MTSPKSLPTGAQRPRPSEGYEALYQNIALRPEVGCFRRFGAEWAKLLHDDTEEVLTNQNNVYKELERVRPTSSGVTVLDCPRSYVKAHHLDIYEHQWVPYEASLRKYGDTLCMSQQIMALPGQAAYARKYLAKFKPPTFLDDLFRLTGEPAEVYQGPSERHDTCAWRGLPQEDFLTKRFLEASPWIEDHILKPVRKRFARKNRSQKAYEPDIRHHVVVECMDVVTCTIACILLTGSMFALAYVRPLNIRIAIVGVFGTLFSFSVRLMAGKPSRRMEVYSATAAFFAVASVFVSGTGSGDDNH